MITPYSIIKEVENYYCLPKNSISGTKRTRTRSEARAVAVALCKLHTRFSYPELAEIFKKDHSSLIECVKRVKKKPHIFKIFEEIDGILLKSGL